VTGGAAGTRGIALQLLQANGIDSQQAATPRSQRETAAADALENQEIDAAFFVAGIEAAYIQRLLKATDVRLAELNQAKAYERQFRFLSAVTVHAGLLDIQRNIPAKDTVLIAPRRDPGRTRIAASGVDLAVSESGDQGASQRETCWAAGRRISFGGVYRSTAQR